MGMTYKTAFDIRKVLVQDLGLPHKEIAAVTDGSAWSSSNVKLESTGGFTDDEKYGPEEGGHPNSGYHFLLKGSPDGEAMELASVAAIRNKFKLNGTTNSDYFEVAAELGLSKNDAVAAAFEKYRKQFDKALQDAGKAIVSA
jgi:hypothetical protein